MKTRTAFSLAGAAVVLLPMVYVGYLWATYIDEATDVGYAYGLSIGDSKRQVFEKLPAAMVQMGAGGRDIFIEIQVNESAGRMLGVDPGKNALVQTRFDLVGLDFWSEQDRWIFHIDGSRRNFLRLSFCGDQLCRIYRHRKYFELP